jgi:hypothetical protein
MKAVRNDWENPNHSLLFGKTPNHSLLFFLSEWGRWMWENEIDITGYPERNNSIRDMLITTENR